MILQDGVILYHGSYIQVEMPDVRKCSRFKDFGQGFYLTTSREQAAAFVCSSVSKAIARGDVPSDTTAGCISKYIYRRQSGVTVYEFTASDEEWLHCIAGHRRPSVQRAWADQWSGYDILVGKVANDRTNPTITAYLSGLFGEVGTPQADQQCISLLMPEKLKDQICLRTMKAAACLTYEGSECITCRG